MSIKQYDTRPEWLGARRCGGTDVAVILGVSPWRTAYDLWLLKTGRVPRPDATPWQTFGLLVERSLIEGYCQRHNVAPVGGPPYLLLQGREPWQTASPDELVYDGSVEWGLDAKFYRYPSELDGWGEEGTDRIPLDLYLQMQWCMHCAGMDRWDVTAAFHGVGELRDYRIERDQAVIDHAERECRRWWRAHIEMDEAPPLEVGPAALLYHGGVEQTRAGRRRATDEERLLIRQREAARQARLAAQQAQTALDLRLKIAIGEDEGLWHDDCMATWSTNKNGQRSLRTKAWSVEPTDDDAEDFDLSIPMET